MKLTTLNAIGSLLILSTFLPFSSPLASTGLTFDEAVNAIVYLTDGRMVVATGKSVIAIGKEGKRTTIGLHDDYVTSLAQSVDGRILISGSWDGRIQMMSLDIPSLGKPVYSTKFKIFTVAIHPNGEEIAAGCSDSKVHIASVQPGGRKIVLKGHSNSVTAVTYSPDGNYLVSGGADNRIIVWDNISRKKVKEFKAHSGGVVDLKFSPRGDCFYSSGKDGKVKVWDFPVCKEKKSYSDLGGRSVNSIALSPDGRYLAIVGSDARVVIRDMQKDEKVYSEPLLFPGTIDSRYPRLTAVVFDAEATELAVGEIRGRVEVVDLLNVPAIQRARALPCDLEATVSFSDALCFYPNDVLDGGEKKAELVVDAKNKGEGPAFDIKIEIECNNPDVMVASTTPVGTISPGGEKEIRLPVQVDLDASDGSAIFTVETKERRKQDAPRQVLEVPVHHLDKPKFEITRLLFNDGSGKAIGNGDGVPQNGEIGELEIFVTNTGLGPSIDTELSLVSISEGIQEHIGSFQLGDIKQQSTKKGVLMIEIPRDYASDRIDYSLGVIDGRGAATLEISDTILMDRVSPRLAYEIDTPREIQNGTSVQITIIPKNLGRLEAVGVEMQVSSPDAVILGASEFLVGKIGAGKAGRPQTLAVDVPRTFDKEAFSLEIRMNQSEFPGIRKTEEISVNLVKPDLDISANLIGGREGRVMKGEKARVQVQVTNNGDLAAADVVLTARSGNVFVVPSPSKFEIGTISAGGATSPQYLELQIPRGLEEDAVTIAFTAEQLAFPRATHSLLIALKDAGGTVTRWEPELPQDEDIATGVSSEPILKPILNVMGLSDGDTIYEGTVDLIVSASDIVGLDQVVISVDGRKVYDSSSDPEAMRRLGSNPKALLVSPHISNLNPGPNKISITAMNLNGMMVESSFEITYERPLAAVPDIDNPSDVDVNIPKTKMANRDAIAVIIGNRDYQYTYDVDFAIRDARVMRKYLIEAMGFDPGNIVLLENATFGHLNAWFGSRDDWKGNLYDMIKSEVSDLFLYYTGHGTPGPKGEGYGYIVPTDCDPKKPQLNGYPLQVLFDNLSRIPYRNLTVVIDACFSGDSPKGPLVPKVSGVRIEGMAILARKNTQLFTSASGKEVSTWYDEKQHSLFTYFFLKGLRGAADADGDKRVTVGEMEDYLTDPTRGVPYHARSINSLSQNPQVKTVNKSKILVDLR